MNEAQSPLDQPRVLAYGDIGRRLREERRRAGRTQADLAQALGVRPATIARYERGVRRVPIPALQRLADALRSPLDRLLAANEPADDVRDQLAAIQTSLLHAAKALETLRERFDLHPRTGERSREGPSTITEQDRQDLGRYLEEIQLTSKEAPSTAPRAGASPYRLILSPNPLPFHPHWRPDPKVLERFFTETGISTELRLLFVTKDHADARAAGIVAGDLVFYDPKAHPEPGDWVVVLGIGKVYGIRQYGGTMNELKWDPVPQTSPGDTTEEDLQYWAAWAARPLYLGKIVAVCRSKPRDRGRHRA